MKRCPHESRLRDDGFVHDGCVSLWKLASEKAAEVHVSGTMTKNDLAAIVHHLSGILMQMPREQSVYREGEDRDPFEAA